MDAPVDRRVERFADALRRLVRKGARAHISKLLSRLRPGDVSIALRSLNPTDRFGVFQVLVEDFPDAAGDVLTDLEPSQRVALLERLDPEVIAGILQRLAVDDAVFLLDSLPDDLRERLLEMVDLRRDLAEVQGQLAYEDGSAGRIMDTVYFALPQTKTVAEAIAAIQGQHEVEMIFYLYVVDEENCLVGVTSLRQLILSAPQKSLAEIMQRDVLHVDTETDQEDVAQLAARYDLLAVPVTDAENKLMGIITVDDIVDVVKEEAAEDLYKMAGTSSDELLYHNRSWRVAGIRLPWLLFNLVGGVLTGLLLAHFQITFKEALFLLTFVPVIMGTGGNGGTQTSTITVRAIASGRLQQGQRKIAPFLLQQLKVGALLGGATGVIVGLAAMLMNSSVFYGVVVAGALFLALSLSSLTGAVIPLFFQRVGVDPAVAAGPLVTTASDITGILIYFSLAGVLMERLVR